MPRATNRIADHEALGQRASVVGTCRADGEQVCAAAHEHSRFAPHMPEQHLPIHEVFERKVGATRQRRSFAHAILL